MTWLLERASLAAGIFAVVLAPVICIVVWLTT